MLYMENTQLIVPPQKNRKQDNKLDILYKLHSHKSKLNKGVIAGCISYRSHKPKGKSRDHKDLVNTLIRYYNKHQLIVKRIEAIHPEFELMPDCAIYIMNNVPGDLDIVLLLDMCKHLSPMQFKLGRFHDGYALNIRKPTTAKYSEPEPEPESLYMEVESSQ